MRHRYSGSAQQKLSRADEQLNAYTDKLQGSAKSLTIVEGFIKNYGPEWDQELRTLAHDLEEVQRQRAEWRTKASEAEARLIRSRMMLEKRDSDAQSLRLAAESIQRREEVRLPAKNWPCFGASDLIVCLTFIHAL